MAAHIMLTGITSNVCPQISKGYSARAVILHGALNSLSHCLRQYFTASPLVPIPHAHSQSALLPGENERSVRTDAPSRIKATISPHISLSSC